MSIQQQGDFSCSDDEDHIISLYTSEPLLQRLFGFSSMKRFLKGTVSEVICILSIALPMALTQLCTAVLDFEDLLFVGARLGSHHLAAAALGAAYSLCLSYAASGLASALDTLISQAYGAKQFKSIGLALNRALIVTSLACIPIAVLYWFSTEIFILTRQDPKIAELAGTYVKYLIPGLWPIVAYRTFTSFLVNQDQQKYPMWISLSSIVINIVFGYLMIVGVGYEGLGFIGAPIATSCTRIVQLLMLLFVILLKKLYKKSWTGIHLKESLYWRPLWQFLQLGVPGMLMDALDIWVFEGTAVPAGILNTESLAAHSVILNVYLIAFMIPLGVSIGGSVRVGMRLGASKPKQARFACVLTMFLCIGIQAFTCVIVFLLRNEIGKMFTSDPVVIAMIAKALPVAISFGVFDSLNQACGGTLKGIGRQLYGFIATLFAYWVLGLPLGIFLAFYLKWGLTGLWFGLAIGALIVSCATLSGIILLVNWELESKKAVARSISEKLTNDIIDKDVIEPHLVIISSPAIEIIDETRQQFCISKSVGAPTETTNLLL
jgi:MATE family multidrug resistance protein